MTDDRDELIARATAHVSEWSPGGSSIDSVRLRLIADLAAALSGSKASRSYLRSLVRMDIRKKERGLAKFEPKPGQTEAEAAEFRAELERNLAFRREVYESL